jgi:hypothetical protein
MLAAVGLLVALILSCLRLLELTNIEEALTAAAHQLDQADFEGAAINLEGIDEASLTEAQSGRRDELLPRLLAAAIARRSPLASVAGQAFSNDGSDIWVASARPAIVISIHPPALRSWIKEVRLGRTVLTVSRNAESSRAGLSSLRDEENVLPIDVVYRAPGGPARSLPAGSVRISVDRASPVVTVDLGSSQRKFENPSQKETQIQLRPGAPPVITIEDPLGLASVRWALDGTEVSTSLEGVKSWRLPLEAALFEKSGQDVTLTIKPEDRLGNRNQVALRFAIR